MLRAGTTLGNSLTNVDAQSEARRTGDVFDAPAYCAAPANTLRTNFQGLVIGYLDDEAGMVRMMGLNAPAYFPGAVYKGLHDSGVAIERIMAWIETEKLDLLISDFKLAGGKQGDEIVRRAKAASPHLICIGLSALANQEAFAAAGAAAVLSKPCDMESLAKAALDACNA